METSLLFIFTIFIFTALYSGGLLWSTIVALTVLLMMITFMCGEGNIGAAEEQKPDTSDQPAGGRSSICTTGEKKPTTSEQPAGGDSSIGARVVQKSTISEQHTVFASTPPKVFKNNELIRIVMVGKTGVGKSATGNTILGQKSFESEFTPESLTTLCEKAYGEMDGQKVAVIDTPGLFDTRNNEEKTAKDISQSIAFASPGPHIFLVVIRLGRFTEEEKQTVEKIQEIFGEEAYKYSMVLFTGGDLLKGKTIEEFLKKSKDLQELVAKCNNQCHVFNNEVEDRSQVRKLLEKIRNINLKNGGSYYTTDMFQKTERAIEDEKQRILKEKEEQHRKEQEELLKKIEKKYQQQLREMEAEREKQLRVAQAEREEEKQQILKEKKEQNHKEEEELRRSREEEKLRDAYEREKEQEIEKLKEKQDNQARQEAEKSPSLIQRLKNSCKKFIKVFKKAFGSSD